MCFLPRCIIWWYGKESTSSFDMWTCFPSRMLVRRREEVSIDILADNWFQFDKKLCIFYVLHYRVSTCPMCKRRLIPRHSGPIFLGADDFTAKFESNPNNRSPARVSENSDICAQMHAPPFLDDGVQVNAVLFLDDDAHVHAPACSHNGAQRNTQGKVQFYYFFEKSGEHRHNISEFN